MERISRVLFVCLGNACRSQMAEGFARTYGSDVLIAASAGIKPAIHVPFDTIRAMKEKNIDLSGHYPKSLVQLGRADFDLVINMSEVSLPPGTRGTLREWDVPDPVTFSYEEHCKVRDEIERMVMKLILELRAEQKRPRFRSLHRNHPRR